MILGQLATVAALLVKFLVGIRKLNLNFWSPLLEWPIKFVPKNQGAKCKYICIVFKKTSQKENLSNYLVVLSSSSDC